MLAGADELDRHAGDLLDRKRRAAAGVAVELRHDDAVELERLVERLGAVDGVLARHAVDDQIHLLRLDLPIDPLELLHQLVVDVQPAGRIENHDIRVCASSPRAPPPGKRRPDLCSCDPSRPERRAARRSRAAVRWPPGVASRRPRAAACRPRCFSIRPSLPQVVVLPEPCRPHIISTVTSFAPVQMQRVVDRAHQVDEFLMDDADDLLARIERLEHLLADRLLARPAP